MEETLIYKRPGKFNKPEFFVALKDLSVLKSRETPKAYAIGTFVNNRAFVDAWIAKSLCKTINGEIYVPTWTLDKVSNITYRIYKDSWCNEEFDVREFPVEIINNKDGTVTVKEEGKIPVTMVNIPSDWEDDKDDIYWSNKFAEEERKQEEKAYKAKMEWEMRNFA